jgi:hypothetical protein
MTQAAGAGVLFMLVLTYALIIFGFGGVMLLWFVRARRLAHRRGPAASASACLCRTSKCPCRPSDSAGAPP